MRNKVLFLLTPLIFFITNNIFAETVALKSGLTVEGKIIEKTQYEITVEIEDGEQIPYMMSDVISIDGKRVINQNVQANNSPQLQDSSGSGTVDIPVNPLIELNGMSRQDILNLRQQYVSQIDSLAPKNYKPNMDVYGQIQDGKPWWGVLGYYFYGPGDKSIEGPSYYSQFIVNPYLLVGFTTGAFQVTTPSAQPEDFTPMPTDLNWEQNGSRGQVIYNLSDYNQALIDHHYSVQSELNLELTNARDFGFKFFTIDSSRSSGIQASGDKIIPIIQYIHTGGSCGYPGGCNNRSPTQADLAFKTTELPARIYVKLWKTEVNDPSQKSDMDFIIDLN